MPGRAAQPAAAPLLGDAPALTADAAATLAASPGTVQARAVSVNLAALDEDALLLDLFDGVSVRAEVDRRGVNPDGSLSWSGRIVGDPLSAVTLVRAGPMLQGGISTLDGAYSIEPLGDTGLHVLRAVDVQALGPELPPLVPTLDLAEPHEVSQPQVDDGSTFDVLVVYTPAAVSAAGSQSALLGRINLGITETNTAFANSGVIPRLRLVGAEMVTYTEHASSMLNDLNAVTNPSDGLMDEVHARRDALGADLVKLVVGGVTNNTCGIAWLMSSASPAFAPYAFSVTAYPCISPGYTFGHELAHNMGSHHAPEDYGSPPASLYPYSFGYKNSAAGFRTVMAYACPGNACARVLHFSNPTVTYNGAPTGTAHQHHNALSIDNVRSTIANWRQSVGAPTISAIPNQVIAEDTSTGALAFTVADGQTPAGSLVVTAASSNVSLVANTPSGLALGGSGANRTLVVTPQPDAFGVTTITLVVSNGTQSASTSFQLTVTAVDDPPLVSPIAAQSVNEDQPLSVPFTVSDVDTPLAGLVVQATSSNTTLIGASGLVLGGSGPSRSLTLLPRANQFGSATITVSVSDATTTVQRSFSYTVHPVNDAPTLSALPAIVSTVAGTPATLQVTVTDVDTDPGQLSLTVASTNLMLLPADGIAVTPHSSTSTSRTFTVTLTPAEGQSGNGGILVTASDQWLTAQAGAAFNVTPVPMPPDPPTSASVTASGTNLTFTWTPATTGAAATSYLMELGTAPGTTTLPTHTVAAPATSHVVVVPYGEYWARVRAVNGVGPSAPSPEVSVLIEEPSPIPGPPGHFQVSISGRTVQMTWVAAVTGAPATGYVVEAGSGPGLANLASLETGSPATALSVPNVPVGSYWVRVRGRNAMGSGPASQEVSFSMGSGTGCVGLPGTPVLLTPVVTGNSVSLTWLAPDAGAAPTSYQVTAGSTPGASNLASFFTNSTATSFAGSAPNGVYHVRLAAANACGLGPLSNEVSFTLGPERPGAPDNLAWSVAPGGLVTLSWDAPSSGAGITTYLIEAGSASGLANLATVSTGETTTSFSTPAPPGVYFVRVRAVNGAGPGEPSNEVVLVVP